MAAITKYPVVLGEEIGGTVICTPSQTLEIVYSPTNVIITRDGRQFEVSLPPMHSQPALVFIAKSPKDLAEADSALKTAAFWGLTAVALMSIVSLAGPFAAKKSFFLRIFVVGIALAGITAVFYSIYLFHCHSQLVK